ncbi:MAG: right-handed parallel beta-helix repeat-containing protein [Candidatus Aenigmatarchaeota archaeon]
MLTLTDLYPSITGDVTGVAYNPIYKAPPSNTDTSTIADESSSQETSNSNSQSTPAIGGFSGGSSGGGGSGDGGSVAINKNNPDNTPIQKNIEPTTGIYIGAYLGCGSVDTSCENITNFNTRTGKSHAIFTRYLSVADSKSSSHWTWANEVKTNNATPLFFYDPFTGIDNINMSNIEYFAQKAKEFKNPVIIAFGHEMNLHYNIWGNQPDKYKTKFKEIAEIFHKNAKNIYMLWIPNQNWGYPWGGTDNGDGYTEFYPDGTGTYGDYVDWVGLHFYDKDWDETDDIPADMFIANIENGQDSMNFYQSFSVNKNKPMIVSEIGAFDPNDDPTGAGIRDPLTETEQNNNKALWISQVYDVNMLQSRYPNLHGLVYFNTKKTEQFDTQTHTFYNVNTDFRIPDNPDTYKTKIANSYFKFLVIREKPIAYFNYTPSNPTIGQTIIFNASESYDLDGTITSYSWNFGDNQTSTGIATIHSYTSSGNYTIILTTTDNNGNTNTENKTLEIISSPFIYVNGVNFILDEKPFFFSGANAYFLWYGNYNCNKTNPDPNGICVTEAMDDAQAMNMTVIRTWGFSDGPEYWGSLQNPAGTYIEASFQKMDRLIQEADNKNTKLLISLTNNWNDFGGMCEYVKWCNIPDANLCDPDAITGTLGAAVHDTFYTNNCTKQLYKNYVTHFLNRTNTLTGVKYKNDPAIFAWELANEPRAQSDSTGETLKNWIAEMSAYIKSIDNNHMVASGEDGFYVNGKRPEYGYHGKDGADFIMNSDIDTIDFNSFHAYNFWNNENNLMYWIEKHAEDSRYIIAKPLVAGELDGSKSDSEMQNTLNKLEQTKVNGDLIWMICPTNFVESGGRCIYYPGGSKISMLTNHSNYMNSFTPSSNQAPVLQQINNITVNPGDLITITVNATDSDNNTLIYSIDSCWFNQSGNIFTWRPSIYATGTHTFRIIVHDGDLGDSQTFTVTTTGQLHDCIMPDCNMLITENTTLCPGTYHLKDGLYISANNVNLICNNTILQGNGSGTGIKVHNHTTIDNCEINNYNYGILSQYNFVNGTFKNNNISNCEIGIFIDLGHDNTIINNNITNTMNTAIYIKLGRNNFLKNNDITNTNGKTLVLDQSHFGKIIENRIQSSTTAIYMDISDNNLFEKNNISANDKAIHLHWDIDNNTFKNNIIENSLYAVFLDWTANNNIFINNDIKNNTYGIYHRENWYGTSYNNVIRNNTFENNNYGLYLGSCENFTINNNIINSNTIGIYSLNSNNTIYHNNIINNTNQASDAGNNNWNYSNEGNYWSDFDSPGEGCNDTNNNSICDSGRSISGGSNIDNFPFTIQDGWNIERYNYTEDYLTLDQYLLLNNSFKTHMNYFLSSDAITSYGLPLTAYKVGDRARYGYSNPTEWGYTLQAWVAAAEKGIITKDSAMTRINNALNTMQLLQNNATQNYQNLFYPYYKVTNPSGNDIFPYHDNNHEIPSIDNGLLYMSLLITEGWAKENNYSTTENNAKTIKDKMNFRTFLFTSGSNTYMAHTINADTSSLSTSKWDVYADEGGLMSLIAYFSGAITLQEFKDLTNSQLRGSSTWGNNTVEESAWFNAMFTWAVRPISGVKVSGTPYSTNSFAPTTKAHLEYGNWLRIDYPAFSDAMTQASGGQGLVGKYTPPNLAEQAPTTPPSHTMPHALFCPLNIIQDLDNTTKESLINKITLLENDNQGYYHNTTSQYPYGFEVIAGPNINTTYSGADAGRQVFETLSQSYILLSTFNALQIEDNTSTFYRFAENVQNYSIKYNDTFKALYAQAPEPGMITVCKSGLCDYSTRQNDLD